MRDDIRMSRPATPKSDDIVVFEILRDSACAECGEPLGRGRWLRLEGEQPLCLPCADLDHLVYLPRGNAALTRRAAKHSALHAVLVRFSRARKQYERQGLLVEKAALERAERECLADADARARARERTAEREAVRDAQFVARFGERIGDLYPHCPANERAVIAEHACRKSSGRVGRTAAAKRLEEEVVDLAVRAHVRHVHTRYDELLLSGWARHDARAEVTADVQQLLEGWRSDRRLT